MKLFNFWNNFLAFIRSQKKLKFINREILSNNAIFLPANTLIENAGNDFHTKTFIFNNIKKGEYEFTIIHECKKLYDNRKLAWATFEVVGAANNEYTAKKLKLIKGDSGIFSYIGKGRFKNGAYHSHSNLNIYKNMPFLIVKIISKHKGEFNFQKIGLILKEQNNIISPNANTIEIDCHKLSEKISDFFKEDTYVIYANISPNVADGSSIWMSSITDILAKNSKVILLLKEDLKSNIIVSNIKNSGNVILLEPSSYSNVSIINEVQALKIIAYIDDLHPRLRGVLVRGIVAANELVSDRRFKYRSISYLTDFYEVKENTISIPSEKEQMVKNILLHTHLLLMQTKEIKNKLFSLASTKHDNYVYLPPSLPDSIFQDSLTENIQKKNGEINIGYAGKIMPNWGVEELLSWCIEFNKSNRQKIKLHIAANKISAPGNERKPFVGKILKLIKESGATYHSDYNREQCIEMLKWMDFVWAYRPALFEENTLELSTKLLEAIAMGQKVICYPSAIHRDELGQDYPFFVKNQNDFVSLVKNSENNSKHIDLSKIVAKLENKNAISKVADRLGAIKVFNSRQSLKNTNSPIVCFAGHDFKFIDPYISYLKSEGYNIIRDNWEWGKEVNIKQTQENYVRADIIFCEWGLANAVWYSKNNVDNKPIYIRVHLQEINERARKFGKMIDLSSITKVIFVSERVRDEYIKLFNLPSEKAVVIPNFVLDDEYTLRSRPKTTSVNLGMVGIVPQRKRFDRAITLLANLVDKGIDAKLYIKGHRPENLDFMKSGSRIKELEYYNNVYQEIKDKNLDSRVIFSPWGNDVALWYQKIDFILSPSDFESFHYALADGILSGCVPVIWSWSEAELLYKKEWIISSDNDALNKVISSLEETNNLNSNREYIINKYGKEKIFNMLNSEILGVQR